MRAELFPLCCGEVFCAGAGGDAPDDQEQDPENAVEVVDSGDTQCADHPHGCADDDDPKYRPLINSVSFDSEGNIVAFAAKHVWGYRDQSRDGGDPLACGRAGR